MNKRYPMAVLWRAGEDRKAAEALPAESVRLQRNKTTNFTKKLNKKKAPALGAFFFYIML
ncbi:hypothetical protein CR205_06595 [Alteribacter lacisalsi]|uniref:Uncharacterized protein n=1 Tax=Alteribacter lacisalsi TaxID=2045244 RepID=A0A2W0HE34_9BACI|nr:hypothetical protein CR205_06595 [Alteribacter lacisalsi]